MLPFVYYMHWVGRQAAYVMWDKIYLRSSDVDADSLSTVGVSLCCCYVSVCGTLIVCVIMNHFLSVQKAQ